MASLSGPRPPSNGNPRPASCGQGLLRRGLDDTDQMAFGVVEEPDLDLLHDLVRAHHPRPAQALRLRERGLDVRHLDVEGDVAVVPLRRRAHAAADPGAVGVRVPLTLHDPVVHRVVGVEFPPEQLRVVAPELLRVLTDDLEVDYRLSHSVSFRRRYAGARGSVLAKEEAPQIIDPAQPIPSAATRRSRRRRGPRRRFASPRGLRGIPVAPRPPADAPGPWRPRRSPPPRRAARGRARSPAG